MNLPGGAIARIDALPGEEFLTIGTSGNALIVRAPNRSGGAGHKADTIRPYRGIFGRSGRTCAAGAIGPNAHAHRALIDTFSLVGQ